jgi:hypothetical protein
VLDEMSAGMTSFRILTKTEIKYKHVNEKKLVKISNNRMRFEEERKI